MRENVASRAQTEYQSYLLRLWRPKGEEWHVQVECVLSGKRQSFPSLEHFLEFLQTQMENGLLERE